MTKPPAPTQQQGDDDVDLSPAGLSRLLHDCEDYGPTEAAPTETAKSVIDEVAAERRRQVEVEGWTAGHDEQHSDGSLALAAACYATHTARPDLVHVGWPIYSGRLWWPWERQWWKPKDQRRDLIRAASLIVAEIERIDRAEARHD